MNDELYHPCRVVTGQRTSIDIAHINSDQNTNAISLKVLALRCLCSDSQLRKGANVNVIIISYSRLLWRL